MAENRETRSNQPPRKERRCSLKSRKQFFENAEPTIIQIGRGEKAEKLIALLTETRRGGLGWHATGKIHIMVGDVSTLCQVGVHITVIKSHGLPDD